MEQYSPELLYGIEGGVEMGKVMLNVNFCLVLYLICLKKYLFSSSSLCITGPTDEGLDSEEDEITLSQCNYYIILITRRTRI